MKKGAMFGLESRTLRKQPGRLFLESFPRLSFRLVEGQQATSVLTAKGAMFGLDARIALAIFGALSVISGAALYNAIQQVRVISLVTDLVEAGKAYEAFYIDTGLNPTENGAVWLDAVDLVSSSIVGWKGPYLVNSVDTVSNVHLDHSSYGTLALARAYTADHAGSSIGTKNCTATDCAIYSVITDVPESVAKAADLYVDGSDSIGTGNLRYYEATGSLRVVLYKLGPYNN